MMFDVLIIGGGVSGISCGLVLGSAQNKTFATDKRIGIFTHQKSSNLQEGIFNNAYGIAPGTLGTDLLKESTLQLGQQYPHITQMTSEKVRRIEGSSNEFTIITNKNSYATKTIVVAINAAGTFGIEGLMQYVIPHKKSNPEKNKIQLENKDHLVADGIYVAGTLAGWRSQLAIAAGSGASVATDILTLWNDGIHVQVHDTIK
jgi:thioredoxin reductase